MKDRPFSDRAFYRKLLRMALPIALQSLMLSAVAAGDAIMLGRIGQSAMAAVSLASQVQFVQNMALSSITGAGAILGAQYWGKRDIKTIDDIFRIMLRLSTLVSLAFCAACVGLPETLMGLFTHEEELIAMGAGYLRLAGWSYLLTGLSQCYLTVMKITDHAPHSALISSGAVLLNIGLNAVFIFGLLGAPAMGVRGAALATLIARVVETVFSVALSRRPGFVSPHWRRLFHRNRLLGADFRRHCLPLLGGACFWGVGFTTYTAVLGHMGGDAAAANSIAAVIRDLICCMCNGIANGGGILVGNELGAGRLEKGRIYGDRLAKLSFLIGLLSAGIVLLSAPLAMRFTELTPQAGEYLRGMMLILALYMVGRSVCTVVINGVFAAGGDTLFDVYSLAVFMWGVALPLSFLGAFVFHWPVLLVYACTCVDEVGKVPWVMAHFRKHKWVKDLTRGFSGGRE